MSPSEASKAPTEAGNAKDCSVLIAVQPASFERLLEHVLHGHPGLRVVGRSSRRGSPADKAARLAPDVIIASTRLHGREHGDVLAELKRSSPASTLIALTHGLGEPAPQGADACLPEDAVVRRLLPVIQRLTARARSGARQSQPDGRRP